MTELLAREGKMTERWEAKQDPDDPVDGAWEVGFTNPRGLHVLLGYGLTEKAARLIAAAPTMLDALRQMLTDPPATLDEPDPDHEVIAKMREIARAAIAVATEPRLATIGEGK